MPVATSPFLLKDRCGVLNYFVIDDTRYSTSYLISGTFSTQVLIGDKSESIGGSYALIHYITEPF